MSLKNGFYHNFVKLILFLSAFQLKHCSDLAPIDFFLDFAEALANHNARRFAFAVRSHFNKYASVPVAYDSRYLPYGTQYFQTPVIIRYFDESFHFRFLAFVFFLLAYVPSSTFRGITFIPRCT